MTQLPYGKPTDPAKRHSAALTDGPDRAGARSMLKAVGFTDEDLAKPLVGVATTWIETMPCNLNQRRLAEQVKDGIRATGGTPMEFNTIAVSDGVSMGTEGMKASLVSREVIADSIELVVRGHLLDGVVCLVGCDKTIPAAAMALGRLDVPGLVLYNGTIYPGTYKGKRNATVVTVYVWRFLCDAQVGLVTRATGVALFTPDWVMTGKAVLVGTTSGTGRVSHHLRVPGLGSPKTVLLQSTPPVIVLGAVNLPFAP